MSCLGLVLQCADPAAAAAVARALATDDAVDVGVAVGGDLPIALETDEPERSVSDRLSSLAGVIAVHLVFAHLADHGGES